LTIPKIKDLVNVPTQKYENIYNTINNTINNKSNTDLNIHERTNNLIEEYKLVDLLPKQDEPTNMKNELKNFLKKQLNEPSKRDIDFLASGPTSNSNSNSYSMF
jgi:hypothetical protein